MRFSGMSPEHRPSPRFCLLPEGEYIERRLHRELQWKAQLLSLTAARMGTVFEEVPGASRPAAARVLVLPAAGPPWSRVGRGSRTGFTEPIRVGCVCAGLPRSCCERDG